MRRKNLKYAVEIEKVINDDGDLEFIDYKEFKTKKEAMTLIAGLVSGYRVKFYFGNDYEVFEL